MSIAQSNIDFGTLYTGVNVPTPTANDQIANKSYVDSKIASLGQFAGDFDASGGVVPTTGTGTGGAIVAEDYWYITVPGTIPGVVPESKLDIGDILYAKTAPFNTGSDFFAIQGNSQKFIQSVGDGVASSFTYTHGFNTRRFRTPSLIRTIAPWDVITVYEITFPSTTQVTVNFGAGIPAAGEFELVLEPVV